MATTTRGSVVLSFRDYDDETKALEILGEEVTDLNYAAEKSEADTLKSAIVALTHGSLNGYNIVAQRQTEEPKILPTTEAAQREHQWLVQAIDSVTRGTVTYRIPCADPTGRLVAHTNEADLADTDIAAMVTALEAYAKSPDGNAIEVQKVLYVSRNG